MIHDKSTDLEPVYLYILSLLPVRRLEVFEQWRSAAGSFESVFLASENKLSELGLGLELIIKLRQIKSENSVEKIALSLERTGVKTLPYYDDKYPKLLKEIYDAPPVLFYRGLLGNKLGMNQEPCVAIVGSRKMSSYGSLMMPHIVNPLVNADVTIVSGMALGIDSTAHVETIKHGARTIAVLGSGIDAASVYPRAHYRLSEQILENHGLLISEQPPYMPALKHHFVARNRIIAGLSLGVVILECKLKSGALITADYAADFNRALYAVPGPAYSSLSDGPHSLIRSGAMLTTKGEEILEDLSLSLELATEQSIIGKQLLFSETEQLVLECMQSSPVTVDDISKSTLLSPVDVMQTLTSLELRNIIINTGAQGFLVHDNYSHKNQGGKPATG